MPGGSNVEQNHLTGMKHTHQREIHTRRLAAQSVDSLRSLRNLSTNRPVGTPDTASGVRSHATCVRNFQLCLIIAFSFSVSLRKRPSSYELGRQKGSRSSVRSDVTPLVASRR